MVMVQAQYLYMVITLKMKILRLSIRKKDYCQWQTVVLIPMGLNFLLLQLLHHIEQTINTLYLEKLLKDLISSKNENTPTDASDKPYQDMIIQSVRNMIIV